MLRGAPGEKGGSCMQGANGTEQRRLCGMYMLYFAGYMAFFSFYALYLTQYGFSRQALGVISSGTAAANLAAPAFSPVFWPTMCFRRKKLCWPAA